jgi:hypothetical protein
MRFVWIGRNGGIRVFSVEAMADLWVQAYGGKVLRTVWAEVNLERSAA